MTERSKFFFGTEYEYEYIRNEAVRTICTRNLSGENPTPELRHEDGIAEEEGHATDSEKNKGEKYPPDMSCEGTE